MFTFGYKLQLVKKADLMEYELFEKSVRAIHKQTSDFGQWLCNGFPLDENTVHQLAVDIEGLHTFIDIYFENKYSSPSCTMMMFKKIDILRKASSNIIDIITEFKKLEAIKARANEEINNEELTFDPEEFEKNFEKAMNTAMQQLHYHVDVMLLSLKGIHLVIEPDLLKLNLGVDIMKEYKKRCKRLPKDKELSTEFTVRFKAISKDDRRFLEKEKSKNERRRTRASDGGISESL